MVLLILAVYLLYRRRIGVKGARFRQRSNVQGRGNPHEIDTTREVLEAGNGQGVPREILGRQIEVEIAGQDVKPELSDRAIQAELTGRSARQEMGGGWSPVEILGRRFWPEKSRKNAEPELSEYQKQYQQEHQYRLQYQQYQQLEREQQQNQYQQYGGWFDCDGGAGDELTAYQHQNNAVAETEHVSPSEGTRTGYVSSEGTNTGDFSSGGSTLRWSTSEGAYWSERS